MIARTIKLREWNEYLIEDDYLLYDEDFKVMDTLNQQGVIEIVELKKGLSIKTNSYVGTINLGHFKIEIEPKLKGLPLFRLLRYAYGLNDIKLFDQVVHDLEAYSFFDLLIYELYLEIEIIYKRGIQKNYKVRNESLSSPRGKLDFTALCRESGATKATLPCTYFNREEDILVNQILLAGLSLCLEMVTDVKLKGKLFRLQNELALEITSIKLTQKIIRVGLKSLNRLTERYTRSLMIIDMLYESKGIGIKSNSKDQTIFSHGYLFDMNRFFEQLVGKLLTDHIEHYEVKDQHLLKAMFMYSSKANPCRRKSPTPRPDYALIENGKTIHLLDAKYKDLWDNSLPRDMLYQLAIYAMSGVENKTATIIYPTLTEIPSVQKIEIKNPMNDVLIGHVILQPLNLCKVAELLDKKFELKEYTNSIL